ncbi:MAG: hypothetical protein WC325_12455, partial [Candidatus Bathyarchaeia archaeon]
MTWENTEQFIRSGHRSPEEFQQETLKTITLSEKDGVKAVVGKPQGSNAIEVLSYLFEKSKGWTVEKAKIERIMPKIFEKYAGPDVLAL